MTLTRGVEIEVTFSGEEVTLSDGYRAISGIQIEEVQIAGEYCSPRALPQLVQSALLRMADPDDFAPDD